MNIGLLSYIFISIASLNLTERDATRLGADHLENLRGSFNSASKNMLFSKRVFIDGSNQMHVRVAQHYDGLEVHGASAILHLDPNGQVAGTTDNLMRDLQINTVPTISEADALATALTTYGCGDCFTKEPKVTLLIAKFGDQFRLAYEVRLVREDGSWRTGHPVYFIDAHNGGLLFTYDDLKLEWRRGRGHSLYSGANLPLKTIYSSTKDRYYLQDPTRFIGTFDAGFGYSLDSISNFHDKNNLWADERHRAAVDVQWGMSVTMDFFRLRFNRYGLNGVNGPTPSMSIHGQPLQSAYVHYGESYPNAFWNGEAVYFGDGDGLYFGPVVSLDIVAHELVHGITAAEAGLYYYGESGALNESISDVFAVAIERNAKGESDKIWKIAEDAYTPGIEDDAIRYIDDPRKSEQPIHKDEISPYQMDVHSLSGIPNYVFYLVAKGGIHPVSGAAVTGIGIDTAIRIWYRALTSYLTPSATFEDAKAALLRAARAYYPRQVLENGKILMSPQEKAVKYAWEACGY